MSHRPLAVLSLLAAALSLGSACKSSNESAAPAPSPSAAAAGAAAAPTGRLPLEPQTSPVSFQWLAADAILVAPETTTRDLAELGNAIARAAEGRKQARIDVYDDAEGWEADHAEPARVIPRRAEYVKEDGAQAGERFVVFDKEGSAAYERNFRDYPITSTDKHD